MRRLEGLAGGLVVATVLAANAGLPGASASAQQTDLGARDVMAEYNLPRLKDRPTDGVWQAESHVQVLERARALGWSAKSATEAWMGAAGTYDEARGRAERVVPGEETVFSGSRASELNRLLASPTVQRVRTTAAELQMDAPLLIARDGVSLDLGTTLVHGRVFGPYLIRVQGAREVRLSGGVLSGEGWGVLVAGGGHVLVAGMQFQGLSGGGVVVTGSEAVAVWKNQFHGLGAAPVLLHGATRRAVVAANEITGNVGGSNWHAGVVITDRNAEMGADPKSVLRDDNFGVREQRIVDPLTVPQDNVVAYNHIGQNLSSGIYSDGGARNILVGNRIEHNSKEGLCLDNGSTANVVALNVFQDNGQRWGKTDDDLRRDFIFQLGRLADGSSPAKVPGVSIDNAAYNEVMENEIDRNYGGGIKMVRTGFYNILGMNTLSDNNEGRSNAFHFFGVELGSATADVKVIDLDFTASRGNEIFGNIIRGSHYAGIFFADGSTENSIFDNSIFGATNWAMESVKPQPNQTFNNLTNLRLRNISAGIDPNLIRLGAGEFDRPR